MVHPFSTGKTTCHVGNLNKLSKASEIRQLAASHFCDYGRTLPAGATKTSQSTKKELTEALTLCRQGPIPEWKLSSFDGNALYWPEKLSWLGLRKAKNAIVEIAQSACFYKEGLKTLVIFF